MSKPKLELISLEEVNAKSVDWLWYPYIPLGKVTIIQGDPGGGTVFLPSYLEVNLFLLKIKI